MRFTPGFTLGVLNSWSKVASSRRGIGSGALLSGVALGPDGADELWAAAERPELLRARLVPGAVLALAGEPAPQVRMLLLGCAAASRRLTVYVV